MITQLQVKNFKCFKNLSTFQFSKLNLLTGINGRGKSSLLQSILLLAQSATIGNMLRDLYIKGSLIDLGNYDDIRNSDTPRSESIYINLDYVHPSVDGLFESFTGAIECYYTDDERNQLVAKSLKINYINSDKEVYEYNPPINDTERDLQMTFFNVLLNKTHFVGADRMGPVHYVEKDNLPDPLKVGTRGEFTINVLAKDDHPLVHENLYRGQDASTVLQQTEEWMSYILNGAKVEIRGKDSDSSVLYMLLNNKSTVNRYKPSNVGFGYSYVLPLIVTGLIAKAGEIIIIENPEAHLHPQAQSRLAEFFAIVASSGVQVFIESHSEHILNGLRVSSLKKEININTSDLSIYYFNEEFDSKKLVVENTGKIENWPYGFFDQQEIDLADIFRLNRQRG